ncbi:MAG: hypothetical protein KGL39_26260 [Patescibacteria group bacterium]|nr:hypothetical protein [Patescibacteria group bacterium]
MAKAAAASKKSPKKPHLPKVPEGAAPPPALKDRIKEFRRVPARDLVADPRNWRRHSDAQRKALSGLLDEIGFANAVLAREDGAGRLILIDGHLRTDELAKADALIPVLVLDVDEIEAGKLLATMDPLAGMAETDTAALEELLGSFSFESPDLADLVHGLEELTTNQRAMPAGETSAIASGGSDPAEAAAGQTSPDAPRPASARFCVLIDCTDEMHQTDLLDRFDQEGLKCRALIV